MKPSSKPRKPVSLSDSVHHRLNMYALAASAAGVGVLALAQPSEGKIVYTPTHQNIPPNSIYALDLNGDHHTDFLLVNRAPASCGSGGLVGLSECNYRFSASGPGRVLGIVFSDGGRDAFLLARNAPISSKGRFVSKGVLASVRHYFSKSHSSGSKDWGYWVNKSGYLGLQFQIHGKIHYGWARLRVKVDKRNITGILTGYAYETIPNKPILAGKQHGGDDGIEQTTLGGLALGRK